jgi:hypothetical protein
VALRPFPNSTSGRINGGTTNNRLATGSDEIARDVMRRYDNCEKNRGNWEQHWEEIARRIMPQYSFTFNNQNYPMVQGQKKTEEMVDATGALALPKFAAAMESMLTPRNQTWHYVTPLDKKILRNRQARLWYDDVTQALFRYRYAPKANFASQMHEGWMGLGAFGTNCMFVDRLQDRQKGLRYRNIHLGEAHFLENHQGIIDTVIRKFPLTARQAAQKYGIENLPDQIAAAVDIADKQDVTYWFIHMIRPRVETEQDYDPNRYDAKGMEFGSYHVSVEGAKLVKEGGYNTWPYPTSRYVVAPGEIYGRSPAMLVLPSLKVLNEQKKTMLKAAHRAVDPVLLAHDDGIVEGFSLIAGDINYGGVTADGRTLVHALPVGDLQIAKEAMEAERSAINDGFLVTLFQILVDTPQMTATEVLERAREKGALLSPTMGRQQSEFLGPMIDREIDVLSQQGLIPKMPDIVRQMKAEYETVYDSPLSRAQRAEQGSGLMNYLNNMKEVVAVTQNPAPLDYIDWDSAAPELAQLMSVPARWILDQDKVNAIRAQRAKQQQMDTAIKAAGPMAGVAKALPQIKLGGMSGAAQQQ